MLLKRRHIAAVLPLLVTLVIAAAVGTARQSDDVVGHSTESTTGSAGSPEAARPRSGEQEVPPAARVTRHDGRGIFDNGRTLVAYYGTAGSGSLGVLGETTPQQMQRRLSQAARPFVRDGRRVQPVYELIVTVADAHPGRDGDYNHHLGRAQVERYLRVARRHRALVLLDVQPGRDGFLNVAKHWRWALKDPAVGLALDPEWRMGRSDVPGRVIGSVGAREINHVSAWLAKLVKTEELPEKLFVVHQFRSSMIRDIGRVKQRPGLAMVQHIDGFGNRAQKLATYDAVVRPKQFHPGFKLFYDEDTRLMRPADVLRIRPRVRFISYQ